MKIADLVGAMEQIAPPHLAESWDNVGLLVGDPDDPLARVLLAIDCTRQVVEEAAHQGVSAIVSYHPPLFEPTKRFVSGSTAFRLARAGVAVYSPHTAFDVAEGGTNDVLAEAVGMLERAPLRVVTPEPHRRGPGRIGTVPPARAMALIERVKVALGLTHVLVAGPLDKHVSQVAVCAGSGGDLLPDAVARGAELFLTGELRHHDALRALAAGLTVVCLLHSASERCALSVLQRGLSARLPGVTVTCSDADREPFVLL